MSDHQTTSASSSGRSSVPYLTLYRCGSSHVFFFPHKDCPVCGAKIETFDAPPQGALVSHTTVWVSPTGTPFKLGLARVECGAQTLCIVDGEIGSDPDDAIVLIAKDGVYHAIAR